MGAPIVYRWDDGNAPVARGERRSLCDILYACLVTGYGTQPGAGWTREFVNATFDKAAFRNNPITGTGFFLQVDGLVNAYANQSFVNGFEVMTSVDDGLFPFNASAQFCPTADNPGTTARPWVLIADDRAFWFICWGSITATPDAANGNVTAMFFGDYVSRYASDPWACGLVSHGNGGSYGYMMSSMNEAGGLSSTGIATPRNQNGVATPSLPVLNHGSGLGHQTFMGTHGVPYTSGGQLLIARPTLTEAVPYSFRGWLPGLYYPLHPLAFGQLATVSSDGKNFLSLRHLQGNGNYSGNYFISLDDWRV